jgi:hypothetical protein
MTTFKDYLEFIKEAKKIGAIEVSIGATGASVKFGSDNQTQSAAVVNDLVKLSKEDDDEEALYWSSGG